MHPTVLTRQTPPMPGLTRRVSAVRYRHALPLRYLAWSRYGTWHGSCCTVPGMVPAVRYLACPAVRYLIGMLRSLMGMPSRAVRYCMPWCAVLYCMVMPVPSRHALLVLLGMLLPVAELPAPAGSRLSLLFPGYTSSPASSLDTPLPTDAGRTTSAHRLLVLSAGACPGL